MIITTPQSTTKPRTSTLNKPHTQTNLHTRTNPLTPTKPRARIWTNPLTQTISQTVPRTRPWTSRVSPVRFSIILRQQTTRLNPAQVSFSLCSSNSESSIEKSKTMVYLTYELLFNCSPFVSTNWKIIEISVTWVNDIFIIVHISFKTPFCRFPPPPPTSQPNEPPEPFVRIEPVV